MLDEQDLITPHGGQRIWNLFVTGQEESLPRYVPTLKPEPALYAGLKLGSVFQEFLRIVRTDTGCTLDSNSVRCSQGSSNQRGPNENPAAMDEFCAYSIQGLITVIPHPSKSWTLRVATAAPCAQAMAAIWPSNALIGRPAVLRSAPMRAYSPAAVLSKGKIRP